MSFLFIMTLPIHNTLLPDSYDSRREVRWSFPLFSGKLRTTWMWHINPPLPLCPQRQCSTSPSQFVTSCPLRPSQLRLHMSLGLSSWGLSVSLSMSLWTRGWVLTMYLSSTRWRLPPYPKEDSCRSGVPSRPFPIPCNVTGVSLGRIPITVRLTCLHGCIHHEGFHWLTATGIETLLVLLPPFT